MSKPRFVPRTQKEVYLFQTKLKKELDKRTMSWNGDLRRWYGSARKALDFASCVSLGISSKDFGALFETENEGIKLATVALLCNNLEARTAREMDVTGIDWALTLALNAKISDSWNGIVDPIKETICRELEIVSNTPTILIAQ